MKFWFERGAWVSPKAQKKFKDISPEDIKSIAIIRHAALGDMILTRAFIGEARKFFPNASITLSVVSNYRFGVPEDMVDRVHIAIGSDQRHVPKREQLRVAKELGYHDIFFDMCVSSRSILLGLVNKSKFKVSYPYRNWQRIFYDACVFRSDMQFEAETLLDMLRLFGASPQSPPDFKLSISNKNLELKHSKPYIVYFTSASISNKCWPVESFAALIKQLALQHADYDHIILEGLADWESVSPLLELISSDGDKENVNIQKAMSLDDTLTLLQGAAVVVCNDTGIRNLAICCTTPTVGIFFSTVPYRYWPRYGQHEAVFQANGSMPAVDSVLMVTNKIIKNQSVSL
ncbi:hypothetical protein MNBD_GAMMA23-1491 [hydrothermal vent metagenome]|uniref:ADP-heptose--lipooligosaccharide heptosyltransferase II n=1 Tax=hydrothermal vent metagenome TaxID=652676 RepID=A0A3B1A561_9ZZZZ